MGQRHQLFAVAKVNGKYRTLAVTHHQWLCGYDVIQRCFSLLEIFRANASGIARELRRAATLDWAKDVPKDKDVTSGPFFPFIASTLFLGTANGGLDAAGAFIYLLSLNTTPNDCINDDGFTVFDISDPAYPRWAFFVDAALIGPWEYFSSYAEQQHAILACREKMFKLSCMPTVDVAVVRELWPRWPEAGQKWTSTLMGEDDTVPQLVSTVDVDKTSPRLKDMTLGKVVDEALASAPEDLRWMTHAAQLPDFRSALRAKLLQQPSLLNPSARVPVLSLAFEGCDTVDLSCLEGLKQTDLLAVVQHLAPAAGTHRSMSLILPNMGDLTATALKEILGAAPITSLDLGETAIGLKSLLKIFSAAKVERFLCPALNKRAFDIKVINSKGPEGFGGICQPSTPSSIFLIGADTSFPLVQLVYVRQYRAASHPRLHSGELNWERMLQTLDLDVNLGGVRSGKVEEKAPKVLVMPLQDTLLSAKSIVEAALKLLRQLLQLPGGDIDPDGMSKGNKTLAMRLAMGMTDDNKTQPIPAEALAAWKTHFCSSDAVAPQIQTGKTGSWTLIVFHECTSPKEANIFGPKQQPEVRYAFYRSLSTGGTQSTDGEGFLKATASEVRAEELVERWQDRMADLDDYAEPMDKERRGRVQKGKVVPASAAEVQGGLKLVKRYDEQVRRAAEKA